MGREHIPRNLGLHVAVYKIITFKFCKQSSTINNIDAHYARIFTNLLKYYSLLKYCSLLKYYSLYSLLKYSYSSTTVLIIISVYV